MAENKTRQNDASVSAFLDGVANERRRQDSYVVLALMEKITGLEPKMWGEAIIGFGSQHYRYESGREGDQPLVAFSPRKQSLTLYITMGFNGCQDLLDRLGKHKTSKACLYVNRLADVDLAVLEELIARSLQA
ncbi:MAG: DUF1801 domain-containing protein [Anaerolineales bacterium]|jgi:hypothetical protein|nr:DUF1801 domain-containing protein [Anaerolineales bacterium]